MGCRWGMHDSSDNQHTWSLHMQSLAMCAFWHNQGPYKLGPSKLVGGHKGVAWVQGECRVLLENSMLQDNAAVNGAAFFASSMPCFMVSLLSQSTLHSVCPPHIVALKLSYDPGCRHHAKPDFSLFTPGESCIVDDEALLVRSMKAACSSAVSLKRCPTVWSSLFAF